mgnify:FL=1
MANTTTTTAPHKFSDDNFADVLASDVPVLVDFWADWCAPCRMLTPTIEQLASDHAGNALVGKLHVDENPQTASRYGINSIPTVLVFKNGEVVDRIVGVQPATRYQQALGV